MPFTTALYLAIPYSIEPLHRVALMKSLSSLFLTATFLIGCSSSGYTGQMSNTYEVECWHGKDYTFHSVDIIDWWHGDGEIKMVDIHGTVYVVFDSCSFKKARKEK